jgi:hypothetical protein
MLTITLKRSAATLVVVAGLLAAAGPASAQILDGPVLAKAGPQAPKPSVVVVDLNDPFFRLASNDTLYARGTQVGSEGVKDNGVPLETVSFTFKGEVIGLEPNTLGTQVGGEGVKAPTSTANDLIIEPEPIQAWPVTGDAGSGANNLRGEAIDIIP